MAAALSSGGVSCLQVYQLQQEKKKLQEDFAQVLKEREQLEERCTSYEHEKIQLGPRLEESKWEVSTAAFDDGHHENAATPRAFSPVSVPHMQHDEQLMDCCFVAAGREGWEVWSHVSKPPSVETAVCVCVCVYLSTYIYISIYLPLSIHLYLSIYTIR